MPKDRLVRTSGRNILDKGNKRGTVRIKPAKKVGKDEDGNLVQNIVRKYPDGSKSTERFSKGEKVGETYTPKKLRKKKTRKLRNPRPKLQKAGKVHFPETRNVANSNFLGDPKVREKLRKM